MREKLLFERNILKGEMSILILQFMKETNKEKTSELVIEISNLAERIEAINCKLTHQEIYSLFKRG